MIGLPVGFFILFVIAVFCFFQRRSKRQKQRINQQLPPVSQQTRLQKPGPQQPLMSGGTGGVRGAEVDGLAYKTELEAQNRPQQYQELNAQPWGTLQQGGNVAEAGPRSPQEVHALELPVQNGMNPRRC
jgi:hypothetical protein